MNRIVKEQLAEHIYRFEERSDTQIVDAYLVCGARGAIMIDGLDRTPGLYEQAREVTDKPLCMAVTHGHPDHAGKGMQEFMEAGCDIYISPKDAPFLDWMYGEGLKRECIRELTDGMEFDLGDCSLKAMALPGHTPGSALLFMENEKILFSSDAIGSGGLWMWLPDSRALREYLGELRKLAQFLREKGDVRIYPGHANQCVPSTGDGHGYLDMAYLTELVELTQGIVEGRIQGERIETPMREYGEIPVLRVRGKYVTDYLYDGRHVLEKLS